MINIEQVKSFLNIDFSDNDDYIQGLMDSVRSSATSIIGECLDNAEVDNAMLEDIATRYQSRGESVAMNQTSIATYRRYSKRPMF